MQRPADGLRKMFVFEYIGLEFKHKQQDDPGECVDRGSVGILDVRQADAVWVPEWRRRIFLDKEPVNVHCEERVDNVFE